MKAEEKSRKLQQEILVEDDRTGLSVETLSRAFLDNLAYTQGRFLRLATRWDKYMALAYTIRDRLVQRWIRTVEACFEKRVKLAAYLSMEYLLGPQLGKNLMHLGITETAAEALAIHGIDLDWLLEAEEEPGLGNGGLGRLAACFLDSLATLQVPAIGYGIRYEFGIFDQAIRNGWQEEVTDKWLQFGNPWEIPKHWSYSVRFGGTTETVPDGNGGFRVEWRPEREVRGIAYDTPIMGYGGNVCNTLRLWKAEACDSFNFDAFNTGDYYRAVEEKVTTENLTKILYPNDEPAAGKELRLAQQVFFASCSLQDMIRIHLLAHSGLDDFHEKFAIQLNDTHPSVAVPELMRLLVDEHRMGWDRAWEVTRQALSYTNHTLMPEALETWPLELFGRMLPRHLEIVYEINRRFLGQVAEVFGEDGDRARRMSLIAEGDPRSLRMAHLAVVGSHAVNGVAELHTELMKRSIFRDFHEMKPEMFSNKTNGVTPRRFLLMINPGLASLISECVGTGWPTDLEKLRGLEDYADDAEFRRRWQEIKRANKVRLGQFMEEQTGTESDPDSLFDVHVKRIHEYKRQHLNALHVVALYRALKLYPDMDVVPRTFVFAGKAAPGYDMAKLMIRFITAVGDLVNNDPDVAGRIKVIFVPDYNVKTSHRIFPAADLSEQISMAGTEASGTGNMKLALNGALTIGTLDGANIEIRADVGEDNFFLFGMTADEVEQRKHEGYNPRACCEQDPQLLDAVEFVASGGLTAESPDTFRPLTDRLLQKDPFMVLADFRAYVDCQIAVARAFRDRDAWTRMSILNVARMGRFSSDRAIREYCDEIWGVEPLQIELTTEA